MDKHLIKVVWIALIATFVFRFALFVVYERPVDARFFLVLILFVIGTIALIYISARAGLFQRNLRLYLQRLLAGNYETGIRVYPRLHDEIARLEKMLNKLADQLRSYDRMRAQYVAFYRRALNLIFLGQAEPALLMDVEKEELELNPAAQALLSVEQSVVKLEGLERIPNNQGFVDLVRATVEKQKVPTAENVYLQLPGRLVPKKCFVTVLPLEDDEEKVQLALIFLRKTSEGGAGTEPSSETRPSEPQRS